MKDSPISQDSAAARLEALSRRAALAIAWERIWPHLARAGVVVVAFFAVSWFGAWLFAPVPLRILGVIGFAVALAWCLAPVLRVTRVSRVASLARIDRDSAATHRPASAFGDRPATDSADPLSAELWARHRRALASDLANAKVDRPAPNMAARDPNALRFAVVLLAALAAFVAGVEKYPRAAAAFDWRGSVAAEAVAARVDAWIDPPAFTNRPPIVLTSDTKDGPIAAPVGSTLVVRALKDSAAVHVEGGLSEIEAKDAPASGPIERRWKLNGDATATVGPAGGASTHYSIRAVQSGKPTVSLIDPAPKANLSGSMVLSFRTSDAYGIRSAHVDFVRLPGAEESPRALMPPPSAVLPLPAGAHGVGDAKATIDVSESPYAGASLVLTLRAENVGGETGESAGLEFLLPKHPFSDPLARALVELRRDLALDPDHMTHRIGVALEALLISPEDFGTPAGIYLGLKDAKEKLSAAHTDPDLIAVADLLWAMALKLEDQGLSDAQKDLRAAEQNLREALKNGADDKKLRELTQALKEAAKKYIEELAKKAPEDSNDSSTLTEKDLDSLFDKLEEDAKAGAKSEAESALDQLQDIFENLKTAKAGDDSPAMRDMKRKLNELEKLMRDQQKLRDDTFKQDQRERSKRSDPDAKTKDDSEQESLATRQQKLHERLEEMQKALRGLGAKSEKGLKDADGAMNDAERDLGDDPKGQSVPSPNGRGKTGKGNAVEDQGRALQGMKEGAQGLQQQMDGEGDGQGQGKGKGLGKNTNPNSNDGRDALGRRKGGDLKGAAEGTLNEGVPATERARRVVDELRKRLADPNRAGDERDYLERLLKRD